jgi:hypothetical protein
MVTLSQYVEDFGSTSGSTTRDLSSNNNNPHERPKGLSKWQRLRNSLDYWETNRSQDKEPDDNNIELKKGLAARKEIPLCGLL